MTYNAGSRKDIRRAEKAALVREARRREVIVGLASTSAGREYLWDQLEAAHVFQTTMNDSHARMAFLEGERNSGLRVLNQLLESAPQAFVQMILEHNAYMTEGNNGRRDSDGTGGDDDDDDGTAADEYPGSAD